MIYHRIYSTIDSHIASNSNIYNFFNNQAGDTCFGSAYNGDNWCSTAVNGTVFSKVASNVYSLTSLGSGGLFEAFDTTLSGTEYIFTGGEGQLLQLTNSYSLAAQYTNSSGYTGNQFGLGTSANYILVARTADSAGDALTRINRSTLVSSIVPTSTLSGFPAFMNTNYIGGLQFMQGSTWMWNFQDTTPTTYIKLSTNDGTAWTDIGGSVPSGCTALTNGGIATSNYVYARCQSGAYYARYGPISGTPQASTPTPSPAAGSYSSAQNVTLTALTGTVICWNTTNTVATNGSTGCSSGNLYTGPITVSSSQTLYFVSGGTGFTDSPLGSASYTISGGSAVTISVESPSVFGWNVIPGSTRRIHATVTNGATGAVTWSIVSDSSGGATKVDATSPNIAGAWTDLTVGPTGGACVPVTVCAPASVPTPTITSSSVVMLKATSVDDSSKSVTFPINVFAQTVQVFVSPFNTRAYQGQTVDLQSWVWGSVNDVLFRGTKRLRCLFLADELIYS